MNIGRDSTAPEIATRRLGLTRLQSPWFNGAWVDDLVFGIPASEWKRG
jgi:hypothetical protein